MKKPAAKRKPVRVVTTPFPKVPKTATTLYGVPLDTEAGKALMRMYDSINIHLIDLTALLDAQRERIDGLESRLARLAFDDAGSPRLRLDDIVAIRTRLAALESRPSLAARVRAWCVDYWTVPAAVLIVVIVGGAALIGNCVTRTQADLDAATRAIASRPATEPAMTDDRK